MVYIQAWQEYQDAAEALYTKSPNITRYCVKWKASEGKLVLKITDNTKCIKFKTSSSVFLNRFEALNLSLMQKMQNRQQPKVPDHSSPPPPVSSSAPIDATATVVPSAGGAPAAGGAAKKKKPKKKK